MIVAVILSSVSLLLIALYHLAVVSSSVCAFSCITLTKTLTHLSTHIRRVASDMNHMIIRRRRVAPR